MKKKIFLVILIILILIMAILIYIRVTYNKNNSTKNNIVELSSIKTVSFCNDRNNCNVVEDTFGDLKINFDYQEIQQWITKVNQETNQRYQETITSNTDNDETCNNVKDIYNYKFSNKTYYDIYVGDKYISVSLVRIRKNLCTDEIEQIPRKTLIYNIKKQKCITRDELKSELNLTDDMIKEAINNNINNINDLSDFNFPIEEDYSNYFLYFNNDGSLLVEYYQTSDQSYYSAVVLE